MNASKPIPPIDKEMERLQGSMMDLESMVDLLVQILPLIEFRTVLNLSS